MFQRFLTGLKAAAKTSILALLVIQMSACNIFQTEDEIADEARVVITGTAPGPLRLITSTRFERWFDEEGDSHVTLLLADTISLDLSTPHDEIYPIKPALGFLVRLINSDTIPAIVSMKVYFDGELNYDQRDVSLTESSIEFNFIFSNYNTLF